MGSAKSENRYDRVAYQILFFWLLVVSFGCTKSSSEFDFARKVITENNDWDYSDITETYTSITAGIVFEVEHVKEGNVELRKNEHHGRYPSYTVGCDLVVGKMKSLAKTYEVPFNLNEGAILNNLLVSSVLVQFQKDYDAVSKEKRK